MWCLRELYEWLSVICRLNAAHTDTQTIAGRALPAEELLTINYAGRISSSQQRERYAHHMGRPVLTTTTDRERIDIDDCTVSSSFQRPLYRN